MGNDQPALRALLPANRAFQNQKSGWSTRSFFCLLIWQKKHDKWQNSHGARLQKQLQTALILCHFHLISSVSRPQRPLIEIV